MDKNFVNIDDLVRQRLSGGEEEERSGAWRNMRDLLDNEMPQKRVGFFNWRRMFSGMAVLLLLGSISLGGYELSSSVRGTGTKGYASNGRNVATPVMRAKSTTSTGYSDRLDNQSVAVSTESGKLAVSAAGRSAIAGTNGVIAGSTLAAEEEITTSAGSVAANAPIGTPIAHKTNINSNNNIFDNNSYNSTSGVSKHSAVSQSVTGDSGKTDAGSSLGSNHVAASNNSVAHNVPGHHSGSNLSGHVTGKKQHNTGNNPGNSGEHMASLPLAASSNGTRTTGDKSHESASEPNVTTSSPISLNGSVAYNSSAQAGVLKAERARKASPKVSVHNTLATNTRVASILSRAAAAKNAAKHTNVRTNPAASSALTGLAKTENVATTPLSSSAAATPAIVAKSSALATGTAKITGSKLNGVGSSASVAAHKPSTAGAKVGSGTKPVGEPVVDNPTSASERDTKKIEKLTLVYREQYYKTTNEEGYYKMDTISLLRSGTPNAAARTAAKQNSGTGTGIAGTSNATTASNNSVVAAAPSQSKAASGVANRNAAMAENDQEPVAGAAATEPKAVAANESSASTTTEESSSEAPATTAKPKLLNAAKKSGGSKAMDKLNEKFNDLKYHVKGVQFAPGLTAGVNSTFFAPESFKGFQFGFTGEFVFSDAVSVMSELKYFHRINNNYSLEDNYYKYTQVGGQYRKDLQLNSYSFSTLHSLELPLSVRYTAGKFSFFVGGNFLYTFSINTGAETVSGPAPTSPTYVANIGNDNAPKVAAQDFDSRFGVGYLFGASFQMSPNLSLDIRNVQTVWDNSQSAGAKYVSGQLYKNPSLQVSIGYRFGSKRSSED